MRIVIFKVACSNKGCIAERISGTTPYSRVQVGRDSEEFYNNAKDAGWSIEFEHDLCPKCNTGDPAS